VSQSRFNLVDEPWIPVVGVGRVSLADAFRNPGLTGLGGNPLQKIALMKLLQAVVQAAWTPADEDEWRTVGALGLAQKTLAYLEAHRDDFWLYGPKPFLQMPGVASAEMTSFGAVDPRVSTGNTTVLSQGQAERLPDDAEKAVLVVQLMGLGLGGKKTDNSVVLSPGYSGKTNEKGKPSTGKPGASLGFLGYLHTFALGPTLVQALYSQVVTHDTLSGWAHLPAGLGPIPWETPPTGESCPIAKALRDSLMGMLVPFSRFVLVEDEGLRYSEGVAHRGYKEGRLEPSTSVDVSGKEPKVLWVDPERRPWRFLTALLSFLEATSKSRFDSPGLRLAVGRRAALGWTAVGIWSGGLRVSSNAGEQYVAGSDDFVDSEVRVETSLFGTSWFVQLSAEMTALEHLAKLLYASTRAMHEALKSEGDRVAAQASNLFWHLAEGEFPALIEACGDPESARAQRKVYVRLADQAYNAFCPQDTARQIEAWAAHRPQYGKYLG